MTAVVLGYDLGRRVLEGFGGYKPHNEAGWHSTGTCGTFGAAAAAVAILKLDAAAPSSALGLAASFSSGLWAFIHDGAMAKRVHAGRAAEGGLLAALLAASGITGPMHVFDDVWGGFFKTFAAADTGSGSADTRPRTDVGASVALRHQTVRLMPRYARGRRRGRAHPRSAAACGQPTWRKSVSGLNSFLAGMVGGRDVNSLPAAQMSLPYAVAARILYGSAGLSAYSADRRAIPRFKR